MAAAPNLANPEVEPTDEELIGLAARAFAGVRQAREAALRKLRAEIEVHRQRVLADLEQAEGAAPSTPVAP